MEESKRKLSYEELNKALSDLHIQYQKLMTEYRKTLAALQSKEFESISFLLHSLFKVLEHPELFKDEFVKWSVENIQGALTSFAEGMHPENEVNNEEPQDSQKVKDEA